MNNRSFILSALIAGAAIGVLANLPVLNIINCFLCLWVWAGGIVSIFLYRGFNHGKFDLTAARGAGLGALSGLIGAFIGIAVNASTSFISLPMFNSLARFFQVEGTLPFTAGSMPALVSSTFFFFILDALGYPLFGAISGFITANLMGKESPPKSGEPS
jgi:hypothetical protein